LDRISVHDLLCYGYQGVFAEENKLGQRYVVNLDLHLDLSRAGQHDDLQATCNYADIVARVQAIVEGERYKLVEAVAEKIAASMLSEFPLIQEVHVCVTKPNPPVAQPFGGVSMTIHRRREPS
jgi:dihydroneopterin aldolase